MPANHGIQGADQIRTGVCDSSQNWQRRYGTTWRKRRDEVVAQRGFRCEMCAASGPDDGILVHHLTYERFGAELDSDLLVVCRQCHGQLHGAERRAKREAELNALWAAVLAEAGVTAAPPPAPKPERKDG